jgi:OOP family OmpA-OmpF porin
MKHLNKILFAAVLIFGLNTQAQDSTNKWAVSFGVNALDTKTSAGGGSNWLDGHLSQAFSVKDNWNILPAISYVGVSRYLGDNFSVGISGSINKLSKYVVSSKGDYSVSNPGDLKYFGIDATVKYSLKSAIKSEKLEPSITLGLGYSNLGDNSYQTISPGVGVVYWATKTVGFEYSSKYVKSYEAREILSAVNAPSMLQHSLGLVVKFAE